MKIFKLLACIFRPVPNSVMKVNRKKSLSYYTKYNDKLLMINIAYIDHQFTITKYKLFNPCEIVEMGRKGFSSADEFLILANKTRNYFHSPDIERSITKLIAKYDKCPTGLDKLVHAKL